MTRLLINAAIAALVGAASGTAALVLMLGARPGFTLEMDRDLPGRTGSGWHPVEVTTTESFAWTSDRAQLYVAGVDRRVPWACAVRLRGGRPPSVLPPTVTIRADLPAGRVAEPVTLTAPAEYTDVEVPVPVKETMGLRLYVDVTPTFTPAADPRQLGVQVDRVRCAPAAWTWPAPATLTAAALAPALLGAMFALIGLGPWTHRAMAAALGLVQAVPLSSGLGPYYAIYVERVRWSAVWIALAGAALAGVIPAARREALRAPAAFAVAFSAAALFVKLVAVLHPSKPIVDAIFHAHRLGDVLGGRYFFTQPTGGLQFPYAIALYVAASPFAELTRDHVALLRVVVSASEAAAGLLLGWAVARTWRDGVVAAAVVVLYHLLPVSYWVVGNANLTNAFGQAAAVAAMAALIALPLGSGDAGRRGPASLLAVAALAALAAMAFLAHVSTAMSLGAAMAIAVGIIWWRGGRARRPVAWAIAAATAIAAAAAAALYYTRPEFAEAYQSIASGRPAPAAVPPVVVRATEAVGAVGDAIGWPIVAFGLVGLWRVFADRERDRLVWAVAAWTIAGGASVLAGVAMPDRFGQPRYAVEFVVRAAFAMSPAVLILAGRGGIWAWRAAGSLRGAAVVLAALAAFEAARLWVSWIR